jgi:hypothetical protein
MRISATPISVISPAVTIAAPMRLKLQYMFRVLRYEGEKPKLSSNPKGWLWQCAGRNPQLLFVAAEPVQVRCLGAVAAQTAVCRLASGGTFRLSRPVAGCDTVETRADDQEAVVAAFAQDLAGTASRSVGLSFERGDVGDLVGSHAHDRAGRSAGWQAVGSTRGPRTPLHRGATRPVERGQKKIRRRDALGLNFATPGVVALGRTAPLGDEL